MFWAEGEAVLTSTHNLCFEQKYEKYRGFLSENFQFLEMKFSIYWNRRVFVMRNNSHLLITTFLCLILLIFQTDASEQQPISSYKTNFYYFHFFLVPFCLFVKWTPRNKNHLPMTTIFLSFALFLISLNFSSFFPSGQLATAAPTRTTFLYFP